MNSDFKSSIPEGWRLLAINERIQKGDMWWSDVVGKFQDCKAPRNFNRLVSDTGFAAVIRKTQPPSLTG